MLNTKGVIFDFNGTLFLDNPKHVLAWSKISQDIRKCGVSEEELREHMNGVPNNKIVEYLYGGNCSKEDNDKYSALKEEYYREFCKEDKKIVVYRKKDGSYDSLETYLEDDTCAY